MKSLRVLLLVALMAVFAAPVAQAQVAYTRKVDSFDFLVDYSGSMMMKNAGLEAVNMTAVKEVLARVNSLIPDLGYNGSLHTFAPVATVIPQGAWNEASMLEGINSLSDDLPIFGRLTPMGDGLTALAADYQGMARPAAVIMASDGKSNRGTNPVDEVRALYQAQPDVLFHFISFADDEEGQAVLEEMAALNPSSILVQAGDLLASDADLEQFVLDVFVAEEMEDVLVLRGVNFAFDSANLDSSAKAILDEAALILEEVNAQVLLQGWTDSTGSESYNLNLSLRRADAVKKYLVQQGVPASSITAEGMGESFKYDNDTEEGRYLNRRTEILFR